MAFDKGRVVTGVDVALGQINSGVRLLEALDLPEAGFHQVDR
jgi:hypothetical protein